ncbi:MAG: hypothetical protein NWE86_03140 [Candidatus Bathyarchaeota archaeon]|nr:hypothetical protein [Candidatus Bathyarchaeota archaeon]
MFILLPLVKHNKATPVLFAMTIPELIGQESETVMSIPILAAFITMSASARAIGSRCYCKHHGRSGHLCTIPLMKELLGTLKGLVRASTYIYNTEDELRGFYLNCCRNCQIIHAIHFSARARSIILDAITRIIKTLKLKAFIDYFLINVSLKAPFWFHRSHFSNTSSLHRH